MIRMLPATAATSRSTVRDETAGPLFTKSPTKLRSCTIAEMLKLQVPTSPMTASTR